VCDTDEMMVIEIEILGRRLLLGHWNPMITTRLQIASGSLVVSWCSPCTRTPWKMMDHPRHCVAEKGMPEHGGEYRKGRGNLINAYGMVAEIMRVCQERTMS
jgi:hypothetical protein